MRSLILFVCCAAVWGPACAIAATDYTGLWKSSCVDGFGVQIKPAKNQRYSVSFCGPGGCFKPGGWMPDTRIEGDPNYKIISPTELGINRTGNGDSGTDKKCENDPTCNGKYQMYQKCENDPAWIVVVPPVTESKESPDCSLSPASKEKGVTIAWITDVRKTTQFGQGIETQTTTVEPFRPIAFLSGSSLKEAPGMGIYKGQSFWLALSPASKPLVLRSVSSFLDHMGEDHCVYYGSFKNANFPRWTLLSSEPLPGVFRKPSVKDRADFARLNRTCEQQGDYPEGQTPPCVRPKLLTVSDFNKNGKPEYWATEPYRWDTGLTVWENTNGTLVPLLQVCVGCSD